MPRKKVKVACIVNQKLREKCLKTKSSSLLKKVKELMILCDVKGCIIISSPNEANPMVWPSVEVARDLFHKFFALPDFVRKKNEVSIESYLEDNIKKAEDQLMKLQKKNTKYVVDELMMQLHHGRRIDELNPREIQELLPFLHAETMLCRKQLGFMKYPPLREPPIDLLFEARSREFKTTTNDVFLGGNHDDEGVGRIDQTYKKICIGNVLGNQSRYLVDQWFLTSSNSKNHHQVQMRSVNENANNMNYLPYQGSSSHGSPNLEMRPFGCPMMTSHGLVGPISQPVHHHDTNYYPIMSGNQLRQYPSHLIGGVSQERININNGVSQFHRNINIVAPNDGLRQEPPPNPTRTIATRENNVNAISSDISMVCQRFNNHHF